MNHSVVLLAFLAACGAPPSTVRFAPEGEAPPPPGLTLPPDVVSAAEGADVPSELLLAISRAETSLQMVTGQSEFEGQEPAYGLMGLRGEVLITAAVLADLDPELVKTDREANLVAAATLLGVWAVEMGIDTSDIDAWAPVVARYSGIADEEAAAEYVHNEVYAHLAEGIEGEGFIVAPMAVNPDYPLPTRTLQRGRDANSVWTPSPNYNSRGAAGVDFVIIHTCEGSYSSCWSWLANSASGVSAHYVVNDAGTEVRALVDENNRAWHISASYDCANNSNVDCWRNGASMNTYSVGIEHAGYASQSSWNTGLLQRSAELTCGITDRHAVPRDSYHIVGHGQLQPWNRTDPGANWPWADYLSRVKTACGEGGGGTPTDVPFIIDSNNGANDTSHHYVEVSASWWASAASSGYWNTGYWVGPTDAVSDAASFWFESDAAQCYLVEAWWTAGSNRPSAITFIGWDEDDSEVGRTVVNQTINGGRWNALGTWSFPAGWNRVLLSRWATAGKFSIADAVRLTPTTCN